MVAAKNLGDSAHSIIVNGRLARFNNRILLVKNNNGYPCYFTKDGEDIDVDLGEDILRKMMADNLYSVCVHDNMAAAQMYTQEIDPFTRAVVLSGRGFKVFQEGCLSDEDLNLSAAEQTLWSNLSMSYVTDYFGVFRLLMSRSLTGHMPNTVKGRLVKGLYQPIIVASPCIISPFSFPENRWFSELFGTAIDTPSKSNDNQRQLDLTCVSMYDYCTAFSSPVVTEMSMVAFMLINCLVLIARSGNRVAAQRFNQEYSKLLEEAVYGAEARYSGLLSSILRTLGMTGGGK